jgi:hypothetical protein
MLDLMEKKHAILATEFGRYIVEHPEFAAAIPENSQIVLQVEGDEKYNRWSRTIAKKQREQGQSAVYVTIKGLKPATSRIIQPVLAKIAAA